jgi:hypothetical protein
MMRQKVKENRICIAKSLLYVLHCVSLDNKKLTPWPPLLKIEGENHLFLKISIFNIITDPLAAAPLFVREGIKG